MSVRKFSAVREKIPDDMRFHCFARRAILSALLEDIIAAYRAK
jgi:hypothetical protein